MSDLGLNRRGVATVPAVTLALDDARAIFDRRRVAWLTEDLDGYLDCWTDDMVLRVPGRTIEGRAQYAELLRHSFAWGRPLAFDFHHLAVVGDVVLAEWTISAERRSDGAVVEWEGMSVCELRDGRISWWREYYDDPDALRRARTA
ncbi:MAG: nuclear transport factor 2 family protein [Actinobacteria bacterium]|nr:MAG: nuclear transport factor 2 family protein [Actinomycetota bacterium]